MSLKILLLICGWIKKCYKVFCYLQYLCPTKYKLQNVHFRSHTGGVLSFTLKNSWISRLSMLSNNYKRQYLPYQTLCPYSLLSWMWTVKNYWCLMEVSTIFYIAHTMFLLCGADLFLLESRICLQYCINAHIKHCILHIHYNGSDYGYKVTFALYFHRYGCILRIREGITLLHVHILKNYYLQ